MVDSDGEIQWELEVRFPTFAAQYVLLIEVFRDLREEISAFHLICLSCVSVLLPM